MKKYFSKNKSIKIAMIILALFLLITIPYALSKSGKNKENQNKTINVTQKDETKKETKKETNNAKKDTKKEKKNIKETTKETKNETKKESKDKTTKKETTKEKTNTTKKQTTTTSKQNTNVEKPKENKMTKPTPSKPNRSSTPSKPKETKKEVVRTTETQSISFNTIDNYAYTGGKSRVYQDGRSGVRTIVKEDGKVVSNTITTQPQDKIIERYVKVQDAIYDEVEKEVDDLDKPVYRVIGRERWFVYNSETGETKYFYSAQEAEDYMENNTILGNWGTADSEKVVTDELLGYETKIVKETVKVQDEVWEWKH